MIVEALAAHPQACLDHSQITRDFASQSEIETTIHVAKPGLAPAGWHSGERDVQKTDCQSKNRLNSVYLCFNAFTAARYRADAVF